MKRGEFFTRNAIKMSDQAFEEAMKGLLEKGLVEEKIIDGVKHYRVTSVGEVVYDHAKGDPSERN